jgi:hypothetical protein
VRLLDTVDACLPHPNEGIQKQAGKALSALMRSYFPVGTKGPSDRLQKRVVDKYVKEATTNINPAATRGFSLALGCLPAKLLAPSSKVLDSSLAFLCRASRPDATVGNDKDAETRRNALVSLARICETVGVKPNLNDNAGVVVVSPKQLGHVFTALFGGLNDYNMERRGDVGSLSRIVAMQGLVTLALTTTKELDVADEYFNKDTCTKLIGGLLKQLAEKLDAVRSEAGNCLLRILKQKEPPIPYIPQKDRLIDSLRPKGSGNADELNINWADASETFPMVIQALDIEEYFDHIISGLVISVGCLTQSVAKQASAVLVQWVKESNDENINRLGEGEAGCGVWTICVFLLLTSHIRTMVHSQLSWEFSKSISVRAESFFHC